MTKYIKWSIDLIWEMAKPFTTVKEFAKSPAYQAAKRYGILNDVCNSMQKHLLYSDNDLIAYAKKFSTISDLRKENESFYTLIRNRKLQKIAYSHMDKDSRSIKNDVAKKRVFSAAMKYKTRSEFSKNDAKNYYMAINRGWIDDACSHMDFVYKNQTNEDIAIEAKKYLTRAEFRFNDPKSYGTADYRGILDKVCSHMTYGKYTSENNVIYIWKAKEFTFNGLSVYKMGMTSDRLQKRRINEVAKDANVTAEIITLKKVSIKATDIEKQLHKLGQDPQYSGFGGCTEFRALTDQELNQATTLIEKYAA
jgi:hypothetical protein